MGVLVHHVRLVRRMYLIFTLSNVYVKEAPN